MTTEIKISKSIVNGINANFQKAKDSADDAIKYAIKVGEGLIKAKGKVPHGQWENWVQNELGVRFSDVRQTQKYMSLAKNKHLALQVSDGTINGTCKAIANASDEDRAIAEQQEQSLLTKKDQTIQNQMSSESKEWYTPDSIIEKVVAVMGGIDLDPCSDAEGNIGATHYYTAQDNGLEKKWQGRVFMNPPYCGDSLQWCEKLIDESPAESITLVASNTDTQYFHKMIAYADATCFVKGRLEFKPGAGNSGGRSTVRNVLFYKGSNAEKFKEVFSSIGVVI